MDRFVVILIAIGVSIFATPFAGLIFAVYSWPKHANDRAAYADYCRRYRRNEQT